MKKKRPLSKRLLRRFIKYWPRKKNIEGSWVHRLLGESIFYPPAWTFSKKSIAGGVGLGLFIAITPTVPIQMLLSAILARTFRVNMPIALLMCWTTNPITLPFLFWLEYEIGNWILSLWNLSNLQSEVPSISVEPSMIEEQENFFNGLIGKVPALIVGSLILATITSITSYFFVLYTFKWWPVPEKWKDVSIQEQ